MEKNKILVTGGAGVIGRVLVNKLASSGCKVLCVDRQTKPAVIDDKVSYLKADISNMDMGPITDFSPEIIFHLAASFERTEETPDFWSVNFRDNITVSHRIIDVARSIKSLKKIIFTSSYLIYSESLYMRDEDNEPAYSLNENDPVETRNLTGAAKYYTEKEIDFINTTIGKFSAVSARIFRVYGCGSLDVISRWIRMAVNNEELVLFNKEDMFDYIFADDVAAGLIKIAETFGRNDILNLGSGRPRRVEEIIGIIKNRIPGIKVREIGSKKSCERSCADMSKFIKLVGWRPRTSLEEGIDRILEYEKAKLKK